MATAAPKQAMRRKPSAEPLRPDELVQVRALLAKGDPRPDLDARDVAVRLKLSPRTVLDLCGKRDGFPNAWKPSHNRVRIPEADVEAYRERRRVRDAQEVANG